MGKEKGKGKRLCTVYTSNSRLVMVGVVGYTGTVYSTSINLLKINKHNSKIYNFFASNFFYLIQFFLTQNLNL